MDDSKKLLAELLRDRLTKSPALAANVVAARTSGARTRQVGSLIRAVAERPHKGSSRLGAQRLSRWRRDADDRFIA